MNHIRRAELKDIPEIINLLVQVGMVHHNGRPDLFKGPAAKYTEEELKGILQNEDTPIFVSANDEDRTEGYAFCILKQFIDDNVLTDIKTLYIDDLCVEEKLRGKHIGRELFEYVKGYAKEIGCHNVTLNVWACNESAMRFYEACGLVPQKIGMETIL